MHRYICTDTNQLRGEAVLEGSDLNDWFNVSDELWKRLDAAANYWLVCFGDDISITSRDMVRECVRSEHEEKPDYTEKEEVQRRDVIMVVIGDERRLQDWSTRKGA